MRFEINEEYLTDVIVHEKLNFLSNPDNPTPEDLIKILKGYGYGTSTRCIDHPEFAKLRNKLEELGYIQIELGWWNGDNVLKPFYINGARFKKNEQFPCGAAIKFTIKSKVKK